MKIQTIPCMRNANIVNFIQNLFSLYCREKKGCKTYSQINILRCHCLFEFHFIFRHLSRIIILCISSIKRFRRMPNIIPGSFKRRMWSCCCKILRRIVRDVNIARSLKFKHFIFH